MKNLANALKGVGGEYEITRLIGGFGALAYVICANAYVGWDVLVMGRVFDITTYCLTFPAGLAGVVGATSAAASLKDRNVAASQVIKETGVVPSKLASPAPANDVQPVEVVNPLSKPVPTTDAKGKP